MGLIYSHAGEPVDQVFAGPPTGPLEPITEPITNYPFPLTVQVDGDRVFEARFTGTSFFAHVFVHDPAEHEVPFENLDQPNSAVFAGDLVAYRTPFEEWNQLVVRDWRTGVVRSTTTFEQPIQEIQLRPDGRAAAELNNGELRFDGRTIAREGIHPRIAGERLVYFGRGGLHVRDADGRTRAFGTTTGAPGEMVADARARRLDRQRLPAGGAGHRRARHGPGPRSVPAQRAPGGLQPPGQGRTDASGLAPVRRGTHALPRHRAPRRLQRTASLRHRLRPHGHGADAAHARAQAPRSDGDHGRRAHRRRRARAATADRAPMIATPIVHEPVQSAVLAGDTILVASGPRVVAFPQRKLVFSTATGDITLAASPVRVAAIVQGTHGGQAFSGPPLGPWTALAGRGRGAQRSRRRPSVHHGVRRGATKVVVRDPDPHEVAGVTSAATFAGELALVATPGKLTVSEWRTGVVHNELAVPTGVESFDLRPDGRVAYSLDNGDGLYVAPAGGPARRIANHAERTRFAGERIVFYDGNTLKLVEPDGRIRPFGVPTTKLSGLDADERRVLWNANGCLLVAPITDGPSLAPGPGPCPRSEVAVPSAHADVGRKVILRVRCVAAPKRCTGTVKVDHLGHRRFSIPTGATRAITFKATRHANYYGVVARTDDGSETLGGVDVGG